MDISEKDQKILWGRAAGRCSMGDCRIALTHDAADGDAKTLGQMAHIVGEEPGGPRGASLLGAAERAGYANRILLCPTHHRLIDTDPAGFPVERLHSIKTAHEMWVEETLAGATVDPGQLVYANLVDTLTTALDLDHWETFIENALHDLVHDDSIEAQSVLGHCMLGTIWPSAIPELENTIRRTIDAFTDYMMHFLDGSEPRAGGWHGPDHSYRSVAGARYQQLRDAEERWSRINYALLHRLTARLNIFADAVRQYLNPMYFRLRGRFLVVDSLGTWHDGIGTYVLPEENSAEATLLELGWPESEVDVD